MHTLFGEIFKKKLFFCGLPYTFSIATIVFHHLEQCFLKCGPRTPRGPWNVSRGSIG